MNAKPYSFRLDPELKAQADNLFGALGLNTNAAVTLFIQQAVREQGIPFQITLQPNAETRAAMHDVLAGRNLSQPFSNAQELFAVLDGDEE